MRRVRLAIEQLESRTVPTFVTITVNTTADTDAVDSLSSPLDANGNISLRSALENWNNDLRGNDANVTIAFAIGSGNPTIQVGSTGLGPLPTILGDVFSDSLTINGNTGGATRVELDGSLAGSNANGLTIAGHDIIADSLVINRFSGNGIDITGTPPPGDGSAIVSNCYIGTDATGTMASPNQGDGILIEGGTPNNIIGGSQAGQGNVISGNVGNGIEIQPRNQFAPPPDANTGGNTIIRNFIGTNAAGTSGLGNGGNGIFIQGGPDAATQLTRPDVIGDPFKGGNVISANGGDGVFITGFFTPVSGTTTNVVQSNLIGTDAAGKIALGNTGNGVDIVGSPNNMIGGVTQLRGNLISGNSLQGIAVAGQSSDSNVLQSNSLGLTLDGTSALPNAGDDISVDNAPNTQIGGLNGEGNKMAGSKNGIIAQGSLAKGLTIEGNFIGQDGLGVQFETGIKLVSTGPDVFIKGNALFNVLNTNIDAFFQADGKYTISGNIFNRGLLNGQFVPDGLVGANIALADGLTATIDYDSNTDIHDATGLKATEGVGGTVNWTVANNMQKLGDNGARFDIRASGIKSFTNDTWQQDTTANFFYTTTLGAGTAVDLEMNGEAFLNGGGNGLTGNFTLSGTATLIQNLVTITGSGNIGDGVNLVGLLSGGAKATTNLTRADLELNGGFGGGISKGSTVVGALWTISDSITRGNKKGGFLFFLDPFSVIRNTKILGNTGPGAKVAGSGDPEFIGCDIEGNTDGIDCTDQSITTIDSGNTISGNTDAGILVESTAQATIFGNTITGNGNGVVVTSTGPGTTIEDNSIFGNTGLGIDLGGDGVTPNHVGGPIPGPNHLQNFPVLTSAITDATGTTIAGTLNSAASQNYTLRFFSNSAASPSGFGEGELFIGSAVVTTDSNGNASFAFQTSSPVSPGQFISATATDASGETSEFSADLVVAGNTAIATSTSVSSSLNSSVYGQAVMFTATVSTNNAGTPTGTVTFMDGNNPLGFGALDGNGHATFTTSGLGANTHSITAVYNPTGSFLTSTSPALTQTVNSAPLTITADDKTMVYGAALPALTASYSGFVNGDTAASLTSPVVLSTNATQASHVGGYSITASGASSPNYTITFAPGTLTVTPASLTITANNQTKLFGQPNPPLTVSFAGFVNSDTAASLTTQPTLGTTAASTSPVGNYAISVSGAVDPDYTIGYASGTLTISRAGTTTSLGSSPNPSTASQPVTLTATVASATSGTPTGSVTFMDGSTSIATVGLVNGSASFTTSTLAVGSHTITAVYGGDTNFTGSRSAAVTQVVNGQASGGVQPGQTASLGFWHSRRGQTLIKSFNGGPNSTALANWLATTFPKLYGSWAGPHNLTGKTNAQVAAFYNTLFHERTQPRDVSHLEARVLSVALDVYATTSSLGGSAAAPYGFTVSAAGLGNATFSVGTSGAAFGVPNGTVLTVSGILQAVNGQAVNGVLYNGNVRLERLADDVFRGLIQAGTNA
jgi:parallel beta-helix repeat protein